MPDLKYDTTNMRISAAKYRQTAHTLLTVKNDLKREISDLKNIHWKTSAGTAFMSMYEDTWAVNVDKYVAVLVEMASLLERAASDYDSVSRKLTELEGITL